MIIENPSFRSIGTFKPPWYLRSGHFQTVLTALYRPKLSLGNTLRYKVPLPNGRGATYIYENDGSADLQALQRSPSDRAYLLLHGLGSSHGGAYMNNVASKLVARGERVIRVDLPGSGPSAELTWLPAHAGCSEEVWAIMDWCGEHLGITDWRAVGFSLGGNILLRMLATYADDIANQKHPWRIRSALAVAPPIDLATCCEGMEGPINCWYARYFLRVLMSEAKRRSQYWPQWSRISPRPTPHSIRQFDNRYTAPLAGYANSDEYYRLSSSGPLLQRIVTPTILLCDRHDPIVPARIFAGATENPLIEIDWTHRGGHLGYLHRANDGRFLRWADEWVVERIGSV